MGLGKILAIRKCSECGNDIEIRHRIRLDKEFLFCCKKCEGKFKTKKFNSNLNVECAYCGKKFHLKPSKIEKYNKHYCSIECNKKDRSEYMNGEGNHQFGLKGELNASWKSDEKITNYGYKKIRCLNHPFKDCDGFVFEHRLVAESYLLNDENSIEVYGKKYLSNEYEVHHIDKNRLNNSVDNLLVLTKSEHMKLHMNEKFHSGSSGK